MNKFKPIDSSMLLSMLDVEDIKLYLGNIGYPFVLTDGEMADHEDMIRSLEITLENCSDWQFEQEAEQRNYYFPDYQTKADKIAELIRQGKDWQKEAMEYFGEITGKIL